MDDAADEVQALLGYGGGGDPSHQSSFGAPGGDHSQSQSHSQSYPQQQYQSSHGDMGVMDAEQDSSNQGGGGAGGGTFDPDKFFESWERSLGQDEDGGQGQVQQQRQMGGAAADLQLSDSDDSEDFEEVR